MAEEFQVEASRPETRGWAANLLKIGEEELGLAEPRR